MNNENRDFREAVQALIQQQFELEDPTFPASHRARIIMNSDFTDQQCIAASIFMGRDIHSFLVFNKVYRNSIIEAFVNPSEHPDDIVAEMLAKARKATGAKLN
jgi:hypothetical protein